MCSKGLPKGFVTAEIAVASTWTVFVSTHAYSRPFSGSYPTNDGHGPASIVTRDHGPPAANHLAELASLSTPEATDAVIPDIDRTPSEDRRIRTGHREHTFVSIAADLSIPDPSGP